MQEHVDDLAAVIDGLALCPAHLVGDSYGGVLCLLLAMRRARLVRSLVLAEPAALTLFTSDPPKPVELLSLLFKKPRTALGILALGAAGAAPATAAQWQRR